jgi:hypothetical protein
VFYSGWADRCGTRGAASVPPRSRCGAVASPPPARSPAGAILRVQLRREGVMTTSTAGFWCEATNTATRPDVLDDMLAFTPPRRRGHTTGPPPRRRDHRRGGGVPGPAHAAAAHGGRLGSAQRGGRIRCTDVQEHRQQETPPKRARARAQLPYTPQTERDSCGWIEECCW